MKIGFKNKIDYDTELERSVLGIFLLEPKSFGSVYGLLTPECFYDENHRMVFEKIESYWKEGGQIDLLTIAYQFHREEVLVIGVMNTCAFLTMLTMNVVNSSHLHTWCLFLRELHAKRIMEMISNGGIKGETIFDTAQKMQEEITRALAVKATEDWIHGDQLRQMMEEKLTRSSEGIKTGISTSFPKIDARNGGFKPGQMVIIAARPSVGKSLVLGRISTNAAQSGRKVGIISLEMITTDVFTRIVSAETDVPYKAIEQSILMDDAQKNLVYNKIHSLTKLPIFFSENTRVNIFDIRAKAEKLHRKFGLDILLIDYLQLVESVGGKKNENRQEEISKISRGMKLMAMDLQIPVIALAQLNRNIESRSGKNRYPMLSDLRESGSLEQDADVVMFIHSDYKLGVKEDPNTGKTTEFDRDIIVSKWRNGEADLQIKMQFDGSRMKLMDYPDQEYTRPQPTALPSATLNIDKDFNTPF